MIQPALSPRFANPFAEAVHAGLTHHPQKELPSMYLYDEVGSALFEVITALPEYGVTRAEERVLKATRHGHRRGPAEACESGRTRQRQRSQDAPHSRGAL